MPEGRFNSLQRSGVVVESPVATVRLRYDDGRETDTYGLNTPATPRAVAEQLLMKTGAATFGEAPTTLLERAPTLVVDTGDGPEEVDPLEGAGICGACGQTYDLEADKAMPTGHVCQGCAAKIP